MRSGGDAAVSHREPTTSLTTTVTTVGLPDAVTYATIELVSCLVAPSARAYGSEGWGFESLWAPGSDTLSGTSEVPLPAH